MTSESNPNLNLALKQASKIYFVAKNLTDEKFLKKILAIKNKFNIDSQEWDRALATFEQHKLQLEKFESIKLLFNFSLEQAYAGHDTNLEFQLENNSDEFIEASLYWDDKDTPDDLDLNIKTYQAINPNEVEQLSGDHIFARAGRKTITDMILTITDEDDNLVRYTVLPFKINVEISPENINQQNINTISIKGRNVVDASGLSQSSNTNGESNESWRELRIIPNIEALIDEISGIKNQSKSDQAIMHDDSSIIDSEFMTFRREDLDGSGNVHINPEGDHAKDYHPKFDDKKLSYLEQNGTKRRESLNFSIYPNLEIAYTDKDGLKKVSKVPDYDYPVFDKPYYEEHPNGDIKHVRLPCVDDETQGTSSFFYDKIETLGIEDRWRGVVWEQHRRSDRVVRVSWGIETQTDRYSIVAVSDDGGASFNRRYAVHDFKNLNSSSIFYLSAESDEYPCCLSAFGSRDLPFDPGGAAGRYSNTDGYIDEFKKFRSLECWDQSSIISGWDDLLHHNDRPGDFVEDFNDVLTRTQEYEKFNDVGSISGDLCFGQKIDGKIVGMMLRKSYRFIHPNDDQYYYDKAINNHAFRYASDYKKLNFHSTLIAQCIEPQSNPRAWRGYFKSYYGWSMDQSGNNIAPLSEIGFANMQDGTPDSWLYREEINNHGSFSSVIDTPIFRIHNLEEQDEALEITMKESDLTDSSNLQSLQFIGAKQEDGSRNYFSNPTSLLNFIFKNIKNEIDQGAPALKLLDKLTFHGWDEIATQWPEMLDDPASRKIYQAKHPNEYDLENTWITEEVKDS